MSDVEQTRRPLWQRILFGFSLGLNILVIGAVAGLILSGGRDEGKRPPPLRNGGVAALIGMLPPDERKVVLVEMRQIGRKHGVSHKQLFQDRQTLIAVIRSDPFDPEAFAMVLEGGRDRFAEYRRESHVLLANTLAEMAPDERLEFAGRLEKFRRWRDRSDNSDKVRHDGNHN